MGVRIQDIAAANPESLWHFLAALPASFEAQLFYAIVIFGALGMLANYTVKWLRKETGDWNIIAYVVRDHPKRTLLSFLTTVGTGLGAITSGVFFNDGVFVGWFNVLWVALTNGFMWDSAVNKSSRRVWTDEERTQNGNGNGNGNNH